MNQILFQDIGKTINATVCFGLFIGTDKEYNKKISINIWIKAADFINFYLGHPVFFYNKWDYNSKLFYSDMKMAGTVFLKE